jgi:hypothetical protein
VTRQFYRRSIADVAIETSKDPHEQKFTILLHPTNMIATVAGIQAAGGQRLAVGLEGNVRATTSLFSRLRGPLSLVGPSRAVADPFLAR